MAHAPSLSPKQYGFMPQRSTEDAPTTSLIASKREIESKSDGGPQINLVEEIKVLGLIIDTRLNLVTCSGSLKSLSKSTKRLACSKKLQLNSEIIRIIYTAVIEPIMMYASNTWAPATELEMIRSGLSSPQRGFAIKIVELTERSHSTSAMILAGLLPLDLRIREAEAVQSKRIIDGLSSTGKELEKDIANTERPHPAKQCP
ncbi:hypothetical protein EVAR_91739_1 [Eumeta japonica]|uniref:Retrovirus-related Pol polyprotein from type-1 retrotransposable element R1 4 n=1 Tax=Eumeta variegata TaxID=151549 RepID=A0A4C1SK05_EUMVA|nr:hypothetical protein EVAR_91739_1 [Eumeta japonica]